MVDSSIMFTKYVSEWATNLQAISLNVGVTTFGAPGTMNFSSGLYFKYSLYSQSSRLTPLVNSTS